MRKVSLSKEKSDVLIHKYTIKCLDPVDTILPNGENKSEPLKSLQSSSKPPAMRSAYAPKACIAGKARITHAVHITFRQERIAHPAHVAQRKAGAVRVIGLQKLCGCDRYAFFRPLAGKSSDCCQSDAHPRCAVFYCADVSG